MRSQTISKPVRFLGIALLATAALVSCTNLVGGNENAGGAGSEDDPEAPVPSPSTTKVEFTISSSQVETASSLSTSNTDSDGAELDLVANEIVWANAVKADPTFERQRLEDGKNSVQLEKDSVYVVAFTHNPSLTEDSDSSAPITVVGDVQIGALGLETLPLSPSSSDIVDLGELDVTDGAFNSAKSSSDISSMLGYGVETLERFGAFDMALSRLRNPDINRNGVYDFEESLSWELITNTYYEVTPELVDFDSFELKQSADNLQRNDMAFGNQRYVFWLLDHEQFDEEFRIGGSGTELDLPEDAETAPLRSSGGITSSQGFQSFQFDAEGLAGFPYDGNYQLTVGEENMDFSIKDMKFIADDQTTENLLVPLIRIEPDADDGTLSSVVLEWKRVSQGEFVSAGGDDARLRVRDVVIDIWGLRLEDLDDNTRYLRLWGSQTADDSDDTEWRVDYDFVTYVMPWRNDPDGPEFSRGRVGSSHPIWEDSRLDISEFVISMDELEQANQALTVTIRDLTGCIYQFGVSHDAILGMIDRQ